MITLFFVSVLLLYISAGANYSRLLFQAVFILCFLIIFFLVTRVEYTPDMKGYMVLFELEDFKQEPFFEISKKVVKWMKGDFKTLNDFYVACYTFILLYFISKFNKNLFLIILLYFPIVFLYYTTQIRFFFGYFFVILAFYLYFINGDRLYSYIIFLLALSSHYSLFLSIPIFLLIRVSSLNLIRIVPVIAIASGVFYHFFAHFFLEILNLDTNYQDYLSANLVSSFSGGLFTLLPYMVYYLAIIIVYRSLLKSNRDLRIVDERMEFLFKLSVIPFIFVGVSFTTQEIARRFIMPSILFHFLFYLSIQRTVVTERGLNPILICIAYPLFFFIYMIYMPFVLLDGKSYFIDTLSAVLSSNPVLMYVID